VTEMPKFLVDESSGKKLCRFLIEKGFDAKFVTDIMPGSSDDKVLVYAEKENRILITNDKDFGELIFRLGMPSSGVILLRLKFDSHANRQKYVFKIINRFGQKLKNNFTVITESQIRTRKTLGNGHN